MNTEVTEIDERYPNFVTRKPGLLPIFSADYGKKFDNLKIDFAILSQKQILQKHRIEKLPILMNGQIKGLMTTKDIKRLEFWPNASRDQKGRLMVGAAVGDAVGKAVVGEIEGDDVGLGTVGDVVGEVVGFAVGDDVGKLVGVVVGEVVGTVVGETVGEDVGDVVGSNVGGLVGDVVGGRV